MTDWQQQQEEALATILQNVDTRVYSAVCRWLGSHLKRSLESLSCSQLDERSVMWWHQSAVVYRDLLKELDDRDED